MPHRRPRLADATAAAVLRGALVAETERLCELDAGVRAGDPAAIHRTRVAARRLRSHLRTFAPLLEPEWPSSAFAELRPFALSLGRVRDLDVVLALVSADASDLRPVADPFVADLELRRSAAMEALRAHISDHAHSAMLARLRAAAGEPVLTGAAQRPARALLPPLARAAWRRLRRRANALSAGSDDVTLHEVRVRAKRARYASELAADAVAADRGRRRAVSELADRLAGIQGILGTLQDAVTARNEILMAAARRPADGPFNIAAGMLLERQAARARASRAELPLAWRALRGRHLAAALRAPDA